MKHRRPKAKNSIKSINIIMELLFKQWFEAAIDEQYPFKAVFMAGGPGSGKTFIARHMFSGLHFNFANSDKIAEMLASTKNINLKSIEGDQDYSDKINITTKASRLNALRADSWAAKGYPYVIDFTGRDAGLVVNIKRKLEQLGYDVYMVFVHTDLDTSVQRAKTRGETEGRTVDTDYQKIAWHNAQLNLDQFKQVFRDNMLIIDNSQDRRDYEFGVYLMRQAKRLVGMPRRVSNPIGQNYLMQQRLGPTVAKKPLSQDAHRLPSPMLTY